MVCEASLPRHIAIIMDGNGRWAQQRQLPRFSGHKAGVDSCHRIVKACAERGIEVLSIFAFSSENWKRPSSEVNDLMGLFLLALERYIEDLHQKNVKLRFIGDREQLNPSLQQGIQAAEALTQENTGLTLVIATNYGGRWDIIQAAKSMATAVQAGELCVEDINETLFEQHLITQDLPAPDLLIRTSGMTRISNFYLWQLSYTELYFTDVLWPDFTEQSLDEAIASYQQRDRRFGGFLEQEEE